jgi:hypothetical protein
MDALFSGGLHKANLYPWTIIPVEQECSFPMPFWGSASAKVARKEFSQQPPVRV